MALLAELVVVATTVLASPAAVHAAPTPAPDPASASVTVAHYLFDVSMPTFQHARQSASPAWLDWSSDGCSTPLPRGLGDTGRSYNFRAACQRHDFGYRNTHHLDQRSGRPGTYWNATSRRRIDDRFLTDMRADCAHRSIIQRSTCRAWALIYYRAVRIAGGP